MARKTIGKKLRFEVYKRDNFTCQYCGQKAPDVILEIDHIQPVSKGGSNDILNLVTSCADCNRGKSNRTLNDNTVIDKQRKQLEELQQRREQIEMMFDWKKSLDNLESYSNELLINYVNNIITPLSLNNKGEKDIIKLTKKFTIDKIFDAIDIGKDKYIKYEDDEISRASVNEFLSKIGGIAFNKNKKPINRKISYIKGICKNTYSYWDDRKASIILKNYVDALKEKGWNEDKILSDLENDTIDLINDCRNWSQWTSRMEKWIQDINSWNDDKDTETIIDKETLEMYSKSIVYTIKNFVLLIQYLSRPFGSSDNTLNIDIIKGCKGYIDKQCSSFVNDSISKFSPDYDIIKELHLTDFIRNTDNDLKQAIRVMLDSYISEWIKYLYLPNIGINNLKSALILKQFLDDDIEELLLEIVSTSCEIKKLKEYAHVLYMVKRLVENRNRVEEQYSSSKPRFINIADVKVIEDNSGLREYLMQQDLHTLKVIQTIMYIGRDYYPDTEEEAENRELHNAENPSNHPPELKSKEPEALFREWFKSSFNNGDKASIEGKIYSKIPLDKYLSRAFEILDLKEPV